MLILTLRTDKPEAELGLLEDNRRLAYSVWEAHRELAETIHQKIDDLLKEQGVGLSDLQGFNIFKGPGSFTGLRIGVSVANALAYSLQKPIVATAGDNWIADGAALLIDGNDQKVAAPDYGAEPRTTQQRK